MSSLIIPATKCLAGELYRLSRQRSALLKDVHPIPIAPADPATYALRAIPFARQSTNGSCGPRLGELILTATVVWPAPQTRWLAITNRFAPIGPETHRSKQRPQSVHSTGIGNRPPVTGPGFSWAAAHARDFSYGSDRKGCDAPFGRCARVHRTTMNRAPLLPIRGSIAASHVK